MNGEEDFKHKMHVALAQFGDEIRAASWDDLYARQPLFRDSVKVEGRYIMVAAAKANLPSGDIAFVLGAQPLVFPDTPAPEYEGFLVGADGRIHDYLDSVTFDELKQLAYTFLPTGFMEKRAGGMS
jgi:hypothetical protein